MAMLEGDFMHISAPGTAAAASTSAQPATVQASARMWLLPRSAWNNLSNTSLGGSPGVCQRAFNRGTTWFSTPYAGYGRNTANPVPSGYTGVGVLKFQVYQDGSLGLIDAISAGLPSWVRAVQYDAECWSQTPNTEQGAWLYNQHQGLSYAREFCQTAHENRLTVVLSPANDLCNNNPNDAYPGRASQYPLNAYEANYEAYVRLNLASAAKWLSPGDLYEYQAQSLELESRTCQSITGYVAQQVRKVSSGVTFLAGIGTTGTTWDGATCAQLTTAAKSMASVVAGYWPNVDASASRVKPMICLLENLGY
jgi:hypothetical protein